MNYLKNTWIRAIISLLGGGMIAELMHISTGDPNRPMTTNLSLLYALLVYLTLTFLMKKLDRQP
ncbi:MAG: hypothetical protein IPH12_11970 [Saprospirales bacterium]|jgi:hypothetical protein|nr:hypothetical protein [Saprospirales bacterium]